jgi:drug/metabolite transporter (DMT)-like permease
MGVYALIFEVPIFGYSGFTYLNFLALGVVVQVLGWLSINYAQGYLPAAIVAPTLLGQPVMTAVLSHFLLDEALSLEQAGAGTVVLIGVYLVHRSRLQKEPAPG